MDANLWIQHIRDDRQLSRAFDRLTMDERREVYAQTEGDIALFTQAVKTIKRQRLTNKGLYAKVVK